MALIPSSFPDCVVAIGIEEEEAQSRWIASGFLYGHSAGQRDQAAGYHVYLVTNRHVVEGRELLTLRFNPEADVPAREYGLRLARESGRRTWFSCSDPAIDVAVVPVNFNMLKEERIQASYFENDRHAASIAKLREIGITEGDLAYVLGFPMGIVGRERNTVIVRSATVARIRDVLEGQSKEFLLDSFVFPGGSGGPVVLRPELIALPGTQPQKTAYLIGVVRGYLPYQDLAVSVQTKRPRIVFEENSGLAEVHPVDCIEEAIAAHLATLEAEQAVGQAEALPQD
jgi:hypothetical protein